MKYLQKKTLSIVLGIVLLLSLVTVAGLGADDTIHVVQRGDTIYSISRRYSVSAEDLMRANNISDPSRLQVGNRLRIPRAGNTAAATASTAASSTTAAPIATSDYRVVRGDTLFSIARNNGITLQALLDLNRFSANHVLRVGEVIKVPTRANTAQTASSNQSNTTTSTASASTQRVPAAQVPAGQVPAGQVPAGQVPASIYNLRWPVTPKDIAYMTGQVGVIVEGELNESVRSITTGNVISAGPWRKFGRVVIVETAGGYYYMYGGCETLSVRVGDRVTPGTEVGKLGLNTVAQKPQLFFMVFRGDTPIDPANAPRS